MPVLIMIFGFLAFLAGLVIMMNPELFLGFLQKRLGKVGLHILNVAVRLVFGIVLISQSSTSRYPFLIETIGWVCISIAIVLALLGHTHFNRLISWSFSLLETHNRLGGVLIITFGAFLFYAFV